MELYEGNAPLEGESDAAPIGYHTATPIDGPRPGDIQALLLLIIFEQPALAQWARPGALAILGMLATTAV
jgi:hypothetical protein